MTRNDLPMPVVDLLVAAENAGFEVLWNARQNISMRYGDRVSRYGWNTGRNGNLVHWYVRSPALGQRPVSLLRDHGFEVERHGEVWTWLSSGSGHVLSRSARLRCHRSGPTPHSPIPRGRRAFAPSPRSSRLPRCSAVPLRLRRLYPSRRPLHRGAVQSPHLGAMLPCRRPALRCEHRERRCDSGGGAKLDGRKALESGPRAGTEAGASGFFLTRRAR